MLEVKFKGLKELDATLASLADQIERNIVRSGLRMACKVIEEEARRNVNSRSGTLAASIHSSTRVINGVPVGKITAGSRQKGGGGAFYAHMVEFGTAAHFIKAKSAKSLFLAHILRNGVHHPGAKMKPFMRPALDAKAQEAVMAFATQVRKRLTKAGLNTPDVSADDDARSAA